MSEVALTDADVVAMIKRLESSISDSDDVHVLINALGSMLINAAAQAYIQRNLEYTQARAEWTTTEAVIRNKLHEVLLQYELSKTR